MTANQTRRIERQRENLVRLCAPRLKREPQPARKPETVRVCRDNIKRVWHF